MMSVPSSQFSGMSPAARAKVKRGFLAWGIVILAVWALISNLIASALTPEVVGADSPGFGSAFLGVQIFGFPFFILGTVFFLIGLISEIRARSFNARDRALARSLSREISALVQIPRLQAYAPDQEMPRILGARLVEVERHFDQQTQGAIAGTLEHRFKMFGTSFSASVGSGKLDYDTGRSTSGSASIGSFSGTISGLSRADLGLSSTTRDNLMGDALFAVFEVDTRGGDTDTVRVISMSRPGVQGWIADLVGAVAQVVGGPQTHAGSGVLMRTQEIVGHFEPTDISYVTDRLKAQAARPYDERPRVAVIGQSIGRNAVIATQLRMHNGQDLHLLPAQFPRLFGQSVGQAFGRRPELTGSQAQSGPTAQQVLPAPGQAPS